ncbi:MAG TPA: potassium-transporting ATPase subunit C [Candidatus Binatia bacterium]|jgi:K+-transporting ATPase ATPase C chain
MLRHVSKSALLIGLTVVICCGVYPLVIWAIGQAVFPEQANGSLVRAPDGTIVGSRLIAQPFTKDEYFQPRPSAASYDGSASASSTLAPSNYLLRARIAGTLGPIVKYRTGPKAGQLIAPDVEAWFQQDTYKEKAHIVAQWADAHNSLAQAWVKADPTHAAYVDAWAKVHNADVTEWIKNNPTTPKPAATDLAVVFFESFSKENPGKFPASVTEPGSDGKPQTSIEPVKEGSDIQATFFDMWRDEHADADLQDVPGDMVTTSGSGLDPHITLENAKFQLDRVASKWAANLKRDPTQIRAEVDQMLQANAFAPFAGLIGEKMVNVLEVNLQLRERYGAPSS